MSIYTVKPGDTLSKIAAMTATTVAALAAANGIANVNLIRVGQVLTLPPVDDSANWQGSNGTILRPTATNTTTTASGAWGGIADLLRLGSAEYSRIRDADADRKMRAERGQTTAEFTADQVAAVTPQTTDTGQTVKWIFIAAIAALGYGLITNSPSSRPARGR